MSSVKNSSRCLTVLSELLLKDDGLRTSDTSVGVAHRSGLFELPTCESPLSSRDSLALQSTSAPAIGTTSTETVASFDAQDFGELWALATSHHVIMRTFPALQGILETEMPERAAWINRARMREQARIDRAVSFLAPICQALEDIGDVIVIKSLDHWPDLGSDLDLYTNAEGADVVAVMRERFKAQLAERSWGDRLANKWNFIVPDLPELVEVHVARLGQTGEQIAVTESLVNNCRTAEFGSQTFRVPAPENRIIISTLQRMYRHFYLRLCDVVDTARLVDSGAVDYPSLKALARPAGIWDGLATYLVLVSGYVESYRGQGLPLPPLVTDAARFGSEHLRFARGFLRVPIFPQCANLYASEWKSLLVHGNFASALRLSLLPGLATAAALELKITGSDKGIW
jgi:hypothetical protein